MRITFPHMGELAVPVKTLLEGMGLDVVVPPPISQRTLDLGVRYSPEFACFPLKLNVGNFIEARELGADTILMAGGVGPCRFGYYAEVERNILHDLGYPYDLIVLDPPRGHFRSLKESLAKLAKGSEKGFDWRRFMEAARLAWAKLNALECLQRQCHRVRPLEATPGAATSAYRKARSAIDEARTLQEVEAARNRGERDISSVPKGAHRGGPLRVGIVGEIYMVLEPFANLNVEEKLGRLGVEVHRSLFLTDWVRQNVFLDALRLRKDNLDYRRAARPYLNHFVGGEGLHSVGKTIAYAKAGFDGVIHIMPFTCMPEIVAQSVLQRVSRDMDIPILHLILDEHTGEAGLVTRLEAFVDLLQRKRDGAASGPVHERARARPAGLTIGGRSSAS